MRFVVFLNSIGQLVTFSLRSGGILRWIQIHKHRRKEDLMHALNSLSSALEKDSELELFKQ